MERRKRTRGYLVVHRSIVKKFTVKKFGVPVVKQEPRFILDETAEIYFTTIFPFDFEPSARVISKKYIAPEISGVQLF